MFARSTIAAPSPQQNQTSVILFWLDPHTLDRTLCTMISPRTENSVSTSSRNDPARERFGWASLTGTRCDDSTRPVSF
jgi:hypothetical protein